MIALRWLAAFAGVDTGKIRAYADRDEVTVHYAGHGCGMAVGGADTTWPDHARPRRLAGLVWWSTWSPK